VIALGFLLLSIALIRLRYTDMLQELDKQLSFLALANQETARSIVTTLTGGLISLVVFSFSMVMVVLNQASSQFSPRLLPGLISKQEHQRILGFYLGAIIYNLMVLARIGPKDQLPIISVVLAILFGLLGLGLFIYFIHSISNSVRIDAILHDLYQRTKNSLADTQKRLSKTRQTDKEPPQGIENWQGLASPRSGYFLGLEADTLLKITEQEHISVAVVPHQGAFILQGKEVLKVSQEVSDEVSEDLLAALRIDVNESIEEDYLHGMHQLVEIAVKAMSPGINDPATALNVLDFLTALFEQYLKLYEPLCLVGSDNANAYVWLQPRPLDEVVFMLFAPLRAYVTQDVVVSRKLLRSLLHLSHLPELSDRDREVLEQELAKAKADALTRLSNEQDRLLIKKISEGH